MDDVLMLKLNDFENVGKGKEMTLIETERTCLSFVKTVFEKPKYPNSLSSAKLKKTCEFRLNCICLPIHFTVISKVSLYVTYNHQSHH